MGSDPLGSAPRPELLCERTQNAYSCLQLFPFLLFFCLMVCLMGPLTLSPLAVFLLSSYHCESISFVASSEVRPLFPSFIMCVVQMALRWWSAPPVVVLPEKCCLIASASTGVCRLGAGQLAPALAFSPGHSPFKVLLLALVPSFNVHLGA
eukprot:1157224-Pelagomonas_calceolata.AAC.4